MSLLIALLALAWDSLVGFPQWLDKKIGHPVRWIGKMISYLESQWNGDDLSPFTQRVAGIFTLLAVLFVTGGVAALVQLGLANILGGWLIEVLLVASFLAGRHLYHAVKDVGLALEVSVTEGQKAVAHIVGRQTGLMEAQDVRVAALESLAENSSDGVIAPLFYAAIFGLPGIVIYKAINTADSMIGHRTEQYQYFGWASARLDDLVNFVPARLTAWLFLSSARAAKWARFMPQQTSIPTWQTIASQAPEHVSPNAGWPEAALAEVARIRLGGRRAYHDGLRDFAEFGGAHEWPNRYGFDRALRHYRFMMWGAGAMLFTALVGWIFFTALINSV